MTVAVPSFTGQGAAVCQGVGLTFRPLSTPPPWRTLPPGSRCFSTQRPGVNFFYLQCPCLCVVVFVRETLQNSNTPTLQHSNTPTLQHSNTPTLQHSNTPTLQHFNTSTLQHFHCKKNPNVLCLWFFATTLET